MVSNLAIPRGIGAPQGYASDGSDAIGFLQFWGTSPALDLLGDAQAAAFGPAAHATSPGGIYKKEKSEDEIASEQIHEAVLAGVEEDRAAGKEIPEERPLPDGDEPINILIAGGADIRHILKTVGRKRRLAPGRKLRFFVHEKHHEVHARHLLLLQVINNTSMTIRERMETFLSLYGNSLVREKDSLYLSEIAKEFVEIVTDESSHPLTNVVNLSHLKFKDRDTLQDIFKGWDQSIPFDIEALRDQRCRGYYRDRYDGRKNVMDWDYSTYIKERAGIIHWYHYKEFCFTGVAYETRLASYNTPNRSLASYTEARGSKGTTVQVRGFWGDIINSPYHSFGTTSDPQDRARLFRISGQLYKHTETEIAEFNVTAFLNEMETGEPYHLPPEKPEETVYPYESPLEEILSVPAKIQEVNEEKLEESQQVSANDDQESKGYQRRSRRQKKKVEWPPLSPGFEDVEVVLLGGDLSEVLKKPRYAKLFHRAFFGNFACLPLFEEVGLLSSEEDPFREKDEVRRILKPPSREKPDLFGSRADRSSLAAALAPGATAIFETMKYQAKFDPTMRLSIRHRIAQCNHLAGLQVIDEGHGVPSIEFDMKDKRARQLEKDATDFLRFVVPA